MMTFDLTTLTRSGYLDRFGRFAKDDVDVAFVRLVFEGESPVRVVDLTWVEYNLLTPAQRLHIRGSGALDGYIDTVGISNA